MHNHVPAARPKTPGHNCRLAVWFTTDRNQRPVAYSWGPAHRAIRVPYADAQLWVAQDLADQIPHHPLRSPEAADPGAARLLRRARPSPGPTACPFRYAVTEASPAFGPPTTPV